MKEINWFARNVKGVSMKEVNLASLYKLGSQMRGLVNLEAKNRFGILIACIRLEDSVKQLLTEYPALTVCRGRGEDLLLAISQVNAWYEQMTAKTEPKWDDPSPDVNSKFQRVLDTAKDFESVLQAELEKLPAYHPQQKAGYSMTILISQAERNFMPALEKISEETIEEIRESGRCLAFDNFTASGFHMLRALELVLHEYYVIVCKPSEPEKKLDNWGAYTTALYELCGDKCGTLAPDLKMHVKKVHALLQQIKDQDRNLIMHPEAILNEADALTLFVIAEGAMMAMAEKLPEHKKETQHEQKQPREAKS